MKISAKLPDAKTVKMRRFSFRSQTKARSAIWNVLLVFTGVLFSCLEAQSQPLDSIRMRQKTLLSCDTLEMMALSASPYVRQARLQTQRREIAVESQKLAITRYLAGGMGLDYGNGRILSLQNEQGDNPTNVFLDRRASTYQVGVTLRVPLSEFLDRKNTIRTRQIEVADARMGELITELEIRQEIKGRYQRVVTALHLLEEQSAAYEAQELALMAAEEQFRLGRLAIDQYAVALQVKHMASVELEKAKGEARMSIAMLEALVGSKVFTP